MNYIRSIHELTELLLNNDIEQYPKIIKKTQLSIRELEEYSTWISNNYTRNCLVRNDKFEIILLCWDTGAKTPIHDHGGKECWVYQLTGNIEEIRYAEDGSDLQETYRNELAPGGLSFMNDKMGYHTIENNSGDRSMSLHIYASPINTCHVYNDDEDRFELKELSYDNEVDLELISESV